MGLDSILEINDNNNIKMKVNFNKLKRIFLYFKNIKKISMQRLSFS